MTQDFEKRLSWLGGIVDGEGSIGLYITTELNRETGTRQRKQLLGFANVSNCDEVLIREVASILETAGVKHTLHLTPRRGNRRPCWYLQIAGMKRTAAFITLVLPYLVSKKQRAELILKLITHRRATMDKRAAFGPRQRFDEDKWLMDQLATLQLTNRQTPRNDLSRAEL